MCFAAYIALSSFQILGEKNLDILIFSPSSLSQIVIKVFNVGFITFLSSSYYVL